MVHERRRPIEATVEDGLMVRVRLFPRLPVDWEARKAGPGIVEGVNLVFVHCALALDGWSIAPREPTSHVARVGVRASECSKSV